MMSVAKNQPERQKPPGMSDPTVVNPEPIEQYGLWQYGIHCEETRISGR